MPDVKRLTAKLTAPARRALEAAAERALRETHTTIEPEHLLLELCRATGTDMGFLLTNENLDQPRVLAQLEGTVSRFPRGSPRLPAMSAALLATLSAGWVIASVDHGLTRIGSASILQAIREDAGQHAALLASVPALAAAFGHPLMHDIAALLRLGPEHQDASSDRAAPPSALASYTVDLTALARAGRIDPVIGRDTEIRQVIDVLMRRQQNNPILTGVAGVGKTAIVEGFARNVTQGQVPPRLAGIVIRSLDLGLLQAGASVRGEYEQRLRAVCDEAAASTPRTVLFIDEAHMLIGAGGAAGQADAANLLKPALARGGLAVIAATTWSEYKSFFEKDAALARRFQVIRVAEPAEDVAIEMLRGLAPRLETHHGVPILEEALTEAVRLSHRFITGRQLPEKAIALLDTACARVAIAHTTPPPELEDAERRCSALDLEITRLQAETASLDQPAERLEILAEAHGRAEEQRLLLASRWQLEQETLARLTGLETRLRKHGSDPELAPRMGRPPPGTG